MITFLPMQCSRSRVYQLYRTSQFRLATLQELPSPMSSTATVLDSLALDNSLRTRFMLCLYKCFQTKKDSLKVCGREAQGEVQLDQITQELSDVRIRRAVNQPSCLTATLKLLTPHFGLLFQLHCSGISNAELYIMDKTAVKAN